MAVTSEPAAAGLGAGAGGAVVDPAAETAAMARSRVTPPDLLRMFDLLM